MSIGYSEVLEIVKGKLIYNGLELEDMGFKDTEITEDVSLFDAEGLALDSVDALEVIAAVQREFQIKFGEIDNDFITNSFASPGAISRTVLNFLA